MKVILDDHPELRRDLVALSVLKDPIILATFTNPETVRKYAEYHRVLIEASDTIVQVLKGKNLKEPEVAAPMETAGDDQLSDDSSSSSSDNSPSTSRSRTRPLSSLRQVTQQQLASALLSANSLSSISQRNLTQESAGADASSSQPTPSARITNSMFLNALSNVLMSNRRIGDENGSSDTAAVPSAVSAGVEENNMSMDDVDEHRIASYQPALDQMFEMGLTDRSANLQAIMLCNGNLDEAINILLSDGGI